MLFFLTLLLYLNNLSIEIIFLLLIPFLFFLKKKMVRVSSSSKKSEGKKEFVAQWPQAFTTECPDDADYDIVLDDTTQRLQSISPEKEVYGLGMPFPLASSSSLMLLEKDEQQQDRSHAMTFLELLQQLKKPIEDSIANSQRARTFVICLDKHYTPLAKSQVRRARREAILSHGKGLFKKYLKKCGMLSFEAARFNSFAEKAKRQNLPSSFVNQFKDFEKKDFRFKTLGNGKQFMFIWFNAASDGRPYEIRIDETLFKLRFSESTDQKFVEFMPGDYTLELHELEDFSTHLDFKKRLPERWIEFMSTQRTARDHLLRFICKNFFSKTGEARIHLDSKSRVIVDGHHLDVETLVEMGMRRQDIPPDHHDVPLSLSFGNGTERVLKFMPELRNKIGETDFSGYFFLERLAKVGALIHTTDTDILYYGLIYYFQHLQPLLDWSSAHPGEPCDTLIPQVLLYRRKSTGKRDVNGSLKTEPEWTSLVKLYELITAFKPLSKPCGRLAVPTLVAAMMMAGNDYVDCFHWVPPKHFFSAIIEFARHLKNTPLLEYNQEKQTFFVKGSTYVRFLSLVYATSFSKNFGKDVEPSELIEKTPQEIAEVIAAKNKDAKKHFPCLEDNQLSYRQFLYSLKMTEDLGRPELTERDIRKFGYGTLDGSEKFTYENTIRLTVGAIVKSPSDEGEDEE